MDNYYELLEISQDATPDEIKKRCQELLLKHHPDKTDQSENISNKVTETSTFYLQLQEARKVLLDVERKITYDMHLKEKCLKLTHAVYSYVTLDELDYEGEEERGLACYFMECRCGGEYLVDEEISNSVEEGATIHVPCSDCTYHLVVTPQERNTT